MSQMEEVRKTSQDQAPIDLIIVRFQQFMAYYAKVEELYGQQEALKMLAEAFAIVRESEAEIWQNYLH